MWICIFCVCAAFIFLFSTPRSRPWRMRVNCHWLVPRERSTWWNVNRRDFSFTFDVKPWGVFKTLTLWLTRLGELFVCLRSLKALTLMMSLPKYLKIIDLASKQPPAVVLPNPYNYTMKTLFSLLHFNPTKGKQNKWQEIIHLFHPSMLVFNGRAKKHYCEKRKSDIM